jgi:hypothetical protein
MKRERYMILFLRHKNKTASITSFTTISHFTTGRQGFIPLIYRAGILLDAGAGGQYPYRACAGFFQSPAAGFRGRSGGVDIIQKYDPPSGNTFLPGLKRLFKIMKALSPAKLLLRICAPHTPETICADRNPQKLSQLDGDQFSLIVSSVPETRGTDRHRNDIIQPQTLQPAAIETSQAKGKKVSVLRLPSVLERIYCRSACTVVSPQTSSALKTISVSAAVRTKLLPGIPESFSAFITEWRADPV